MKFTRFPTLPDVILIEPDLYQDARGFFMETYQAERYGRHRDETRKDCMTATSPEAMSTDFKGIILAGGSKRCGVS